MKTIDRLLEETGATIDEIAVRAKLPPERMEAIGDGRWLPSPQERARIAAALDVEVEDISWGHSMAPRNIRYHRFGMPGEESET